VPAAGGAVLALTKGTGIEWSPAPSQDGGTVVFLRSDARRPPRVAVLAGRGEPRDLQTDLIPDGFPTGRLVEPMPVVFPAADGLPIHAQLFRPADLKPGARCPAVIYFHGGSRRQMLLGWHYMDYYRNAYAMNQYLVSQGFIVLSVNYRSGIGYGLEFREATNYGVQGASEYQDVVGAGLYLRARPDVVPDRIGLWGGSYGGYLTALGLARASALFRAGVDIHGVHDWNSEIRNWVPAYDPALQPEFAKRAFEASPLSAVDTWRSPVLLIHGDDDRTVPFSEDLTQQYIVGRWGAESLNGTNLGGSGLEAAAFLTDAQLADLPPIEWDIHGILPTGGLSFLVGQPGTGKSLLALWFACCVSAGRHWLNRTVEQGSVIYVAAEGSRSLRSRLETWKSCSGHEGKDSGVRWFPHRLALRDIRSVEDFIARAAGLPPRLVIIDTLARCIQGTKENDSDGVGAALGAVDRIREVLGAGVLLLAHPSRDGGDSPRGHSSQDGAADAIWVLRDQDGDRVLSCAKLKDGDESVEVRLALVQRGGSVALVPAGTAEVRRRLTPGQLRVLATIGDTNTGEGITAPTIIEASNVAKSSVHFILKNLRDKELVSVKAQKWRLTNAGFGQLSRVSSGRSSDG
jgi:acetyl esterase/lipase